MGTIAFPNKDVPLDDRIPAVIKFRN